MTLRICPKCDGTKFFPRARCVNGPQQKEGDFHYVHYDEHWGGPSIEEVKRHRRWEASVALKPKGKPDECPGCRCLGQHVISSSVVSFNHPTRRYLCLNQSCPQRDGEVRVSWLVHYKAVKREIDYPHCEMTPPIEEKF